MRRVMLSAAVLLLFSPSALTQRPVPPVIGTHISVQTAKFTVGTTDRSFAGTEEYTISVAAGGYKITGESSLKTPGGPMLLSEETVYASDFSLVRYELTADAPTGKQLVRATRNGGKIDFAVTANGQSPTSSADLQSGAMVVDNLIVAHVQTLLDRFADSPKNAYPIKFQAVIPQRMAAATATFDQAGTANGTLDGKPVMLRRFTLTIGAVMLEIFADSQNRLMRATVPSQSFEILREGFVAAAVPVAPPEASNCISREQPLLSAGLTMSGVLCLPKVASKEHRVPIVVFVSGSGPNDRDETIVPNKPFRDLAEGLAAAGIASYRFDKRTYANKAWFLSHPVTIGNEAIEDAVAAVALAHTVPEADPGQVFLLGHSQGASFAPTIARLAGNVRGVILMAGTTLPLDQLVIRQQKQGALRGGASEAESKAVEQEWTKKFADVRSGKTPDTENVFFAPASYWRDYLAYDLRSEFQRLAVPALVLQGEKDIQVEVSDYKLVQEALKDKPKGMVQTRLFPGLNHLFMPVKGESTGAEYGIPSHVDPEVIRSISEWVRGAAQTQTKSN